MTSQPNDSYFETTVEVQQFCELTVPLLRNRKLKTEADIQSEIRDLLIFGGLSLNDEFINVYLEASVGGGKRIDIELGFTVIECKRNLTPNRSFQEAVKQLCSYMEDRRHEVGLDYNGILTDGVNWRLFALRDGNPQLISTFTLDETRESSSKLKIWLESVICTEQGIKPTAASITERLGAESPSCKIDMLFLEELYSELKYNTEVETKRDLWSRLLRTAFGSAFQDTDRLFLEHTYLSVMAALIAHEVVGIPTSTYTNHSEVRSILCGDFFSKIDILGVIEADFFDWILLSESGYIFVHRLSQKISRFSWGLNLDHDVLKSLYQSIVPPSERHRLGEYYTPDWLADLIVKDNITDPLNQRVMDPACGSGTFLFAAVRHYLESAHTQNVDVRIALSRVTQMVVGFDVHPVAVTLARVTYLLAIGFDRLQERPKIRIPVSLGDSLQWNKSPEESIDNSFVVKTLDGVELIPSLIEWPPTSVSNDETFDDLVEALVTKATDRVPKDRQIRSIKRVLQKFKISDKDAETIEVAYKTLCLLHDEGRDHIWSYFIRNLARPHRAALPENKCDVIIGNPPWLSYRFMTQEMRERFKSDSVTRGLWAGAELATSQDLSAYFVVRSVELYLKPGGRFAFVMPKAAISRPHYEGFRSGTFPTPFKEVKVHFDSVSDFAEIKPAIFPMPCCVIGGKQALENGGEDSTEFPKVMTKYHGLVDPCNSSTWEAVLKNIKRSELPLSIPTGVHKSPYGKRFSQGATLTPRCLLFVNKTDPGRLGVAIGTTAISSQKDSQDKKQWKLLPVRNSVVEDMFVHPVHLGRTLLPFRMMEPCTAVLPIASNTILSDAELEEYQKMSKWWEECNYLWDTNRTSNMSLHDRIDYHGTLRNQLQFNPIRVVYNRSGSRLISAIVTDSRAIIDTKLYWASVDSIEEARYLTAVLNSDILTELVNPIQGSGNYGPRDFYSLPFEFQIPLFDPKDTLHQSLSSCAARSEETAALILLKDGVGFQTARRRIANALDESGLSTEMSDLVSSLVLE